MSGTLEQRPFGRTGAHARARRSLHRVSSNPSQPPYPRHSRPTRLRQPSLPLPQPPARPRADQSRPRCTSRVLYARSVLDYSSYHFVSRTAFDDDATGANRAHDANYATFHRIDGFRREL